MLALETLGVLRLSGPDGDVLAGRRKELALLAYLARRAPRAATRAELTALLWGERDEARARHSLRQAILQLKRVLGDALLADAESVALRGPISLDVAAFEAAAADGRHADVVALWHGDFLAAAEDVGGSGYRLWVEGERVTLRTRLAGAFDALVSRAESRGDWREGVAAAERWTAALPLDERGQLELLQLLRLDGREAEARARYAEFDARVREELGRGPVAELERFAARLARGGDAERVPAGDSATGRAALFTPELAGRSAAFGELAAAWNAVREGGAAVVLVEGAAGVGKTRLCQELVHWAARGSDPASEPACILWGRGEPGDAAPWALARRLLAPLAAAPGLAGAAPEQLAELAALVPPVGALYSALPSATVAEAAVADAVVHVVGAVASEGPVLVAVDDFTLADPATQRMLVALARRPAATAVLLLLVEAADGRDPVGTLAELRALRPVRRLRLQPLRRPDVETLLASMLTLDASDRATLAAWLAAEAAGNPRRVVELVTSLVDRGTLRQEAVGVWRLVASLPEPGPGGAGDASPAPDEQLAAARAAAPERDARWRSPRPALAVAVALLLALGGGALYAARARYAAPPASAAIASRSRAAAAGEARSIAVIPLAHASADSAMEYFTEGVTDELVHALSSVEGLRVAARTSVLALRGRQLDAREIGRALGVDVVIEGSVRTAGDSARITVQLVSTADGYDLWSARYDRGMRDALAVQEEIARAIVGRLRPQGASAAGLAAGTHDPKAHDLFLRARHIANRPGAANQRRAIEYYQQAIARDSGFARAYAGVAHAQLALARRDEPYDEGVSIARVMAERSLRLDPGNADGHLALAALLRSELRWREAEAEYARAIAANPNDVRVRHSYAHLLVEVGRLDEALAESRAALALDPLDPRIAAHLCFQHYQARRFDDALTACRQALELDPSFPDSHAKLSWVYAARGDSERALAELDEEVRISGDIPEYRAQRALVLARAGRHAEARSVLGQVPRATARARQPLGTMAAAYAALGERDRAFAMLDESITMRGAETETLLTEAMLDPLRRDARFVALLRRVGLADRARPDSAVRSGG